MFENKQNPEKTAESILIFALGIMVVILLPILAPACVLGYLLHCSWLVGDERRIKRSFIILLSFGCLLLGFWNVVFKIFPDYAFKTVHGLIPKYVDSQAVLKGAFLNYLVGLSLVVSLVVALVNRYKIAPSKVPYDRLRGAILKLTIPSRFIVRAFAVVAVGRPILFVFLLAPLVVLLLLPPLLIESVIYIFTGKHYETNICFAYALMGAYSYYAEYKGTGRLSKRQMKKIASKEDIDIGLTIDGQNGRLTLSWSDINHHVHVLGQPGAGKSVFLRNIYAHQILSGQGMLMIDLKADLDVKAEIRGLAKASARQNDVVIVDLANPLKSSGYNPLLRGNSSELKDKILNSVDWSEPYYKKVSEKYLLLIFNGLVIVRDQLRLIPTLSDVYECLTYPEALVTLSRKVESFNPQVAEDIFEAARDLKQKSFDALTGIRTDISTMLSSNFGPILSRSESFDLLKVIKEKKILLVQLDGQTYSDTSVRLGRMLISDLRSASGAIVSTETKDKRPKFTVIVDEFADIVSNEAMSEGFVSLLNRCRGSGIGVVIAHQSLGDFKDPRARTQVMDSTETTISFTQKDPESCDILAGIAGTRESVAKTVQTEKFLFFDSYTGKGSERLTQEFIFHPNDFKNLDRGEAIYMAKRPTRHAMILVNNIKVPLDTSEIEPPSSSTSSMMLSLRNLRSSRGNEFEARLKKATEKEPDI